MKSLSLDSRLEIYNFQDLPKKIVSEIQQFEEVRRVQIKFPLLILGPVKLKILVQLNCCAKQCCNFPQKDASHRKKLEANMIWTGISFFLALLLPVQVVPQLNDFISQMCSLSHLNFCVDHLPSHKQKRKAQNKRISHNIIIID